MNPETLVIKSESPQPLRGHRTQVTALAFNYDKSTHNSRWLASRSNDKTVRLWDLDHPEIESVVLGKLERSFAFDPEGRWLATGSGDGTVRLWQLDIAPLLERACRTAGRNLTQKEWEQYVGKTTDYKITCPQFPSGEESADKTDSKIP